MLMSGPAPAAWKAEWNEVKSSWTVHVEKDGTRLRLQPRHFVIATGLNGTAYTPKLQNQETFAGVTMHSSQYVSGASQEGKKVVVVGSGTSAHDICQDLWEHGADVTMIQPQPHTNHQGQHPSADLLATASWY